MKHRAGVLAAFVVVGLAACLTGARAGWTQAAAAEVKVIEMTAKKYEYSPSEIRVKRGTHVQLKIRALDRTHGFKIALYPDGTGESGEPGLKFEAQQDKWKVSKGDEITIAFVAERVGKYPFKCSSFCGMGHSGMKGVLIVEE